MSEEVKVPSPSLADGIREVERLRERAVKRQSFFERDSINWKAMRFVLDEYDEILHALKSLQPVDQSQKEKK